MISDSHKFIFLHVGKCAGTSIKEAMIEHPLVNVHDSDYHLSLQEMEDVVRSDGYDPSEYFKFSVTRNPWDRVVSQYYHMINAPTIWIYPHMGKILADGGKRPDHDELKKLQFKGSFDDFVDQLPYTSTPYNDVDFVIRYENLKDDFNHVCNHIGIDPVDLPHVHYNTGRPRTPYVKYYSNRTRDIVAERFAEDIKTFKYTYDIY